MNKLWILQKSDGEHFRNLAYFLDLDVAQEALERIRNDYMDFYINTAERIQAWNERPYEHYVPTYDEETGLRVYHRGEWIEDRLRQLEDEMYSYALYEVEYVPDIEHFKFEDTKWYHQDDDKDENAYKLMVERTRIRNKQRADYLESRKDKPKGLPL